MLDNTFLLQRFRHWKEATVDAFVLGMQRLHTYYNNEIKRGLAGLGSYHLEPCYAAEAIMPEDMKVLCYSLYLLLLKYELNAKKFTGIK